VDGRDLIAGFGLGADVQTSVGLLRAPKHESLRPEDERGATGGAGLEAAVEADLVACVRWAEQPVRIESADRRWVPDIRAVGPREAARAKAVLRQMDFDRRREASGIDELAAEPREHGVEPTGSNEAQRAPDPSTWFETAQGERILLIEDHPRLAGVVLPNSKVHAVIREIAEKRLGSIREPAARTAVQRLTKDSPTRREAVHAIGSVVAAQIFDVAQGKSRADAAAAQSRCDAASDRLSATRWRKARR
jgi:hypothetical protein